MPSKKSISRTSINVGICPIKIGEIGEFYICKLNDLPEIYFHIKVSLYVDHRKKKKKKPHYIYVF